MLNQRPQGMLEVGSADREGEEATQVIQLGYAKRGMVEGLARR